MIFWPQKAPAVKMAFGADWAPTLAKLDDPTIALSVWEVVSGSVVLSSGAISGSKTSTKVEGGEDKEEQVLRNTITTSAGDILSTLVYQMVKEQL